jgi:CheY-like chemotaxis protein
MSTILIVDDEVSMLEVLSEMLSSAAASTW